MRRVAPVDHDARPDPVGDSRAPRELLRGGAVRKEASPCELLDDVPQRPAVDVAAAASVVGPREHNAHARERRECLEEAPLVLPGHLYFVNKPDMAGQRGPSD